MSFDVDALRLPDGFAEQQAFKQRQRGEIIAEQAYAQGKMLDHSGWTGFLPRNITPSDIDMVIANGQSMMLIEWSSRSSAIYVAVTTI